MAIIILVYVIAFVLEVLLTAAIITIVLSVYDGCGLRRAWSRCWSEPFFIAVIALTRLILEAVV